MIEWVVVVMVSLNTGGSMLMERHEVGYSYFESKALCDRYITREGEQNIIDEVDEILGEHVTRMSNPFCTPKNRKDGEYPEFPDYDWQLRPNPDGILA